MIKIERLKDVSIPVMGVLEDSVVDGEGLRFALFVQGCSHHCKGCHNPQSWHMTNNNLLTLYEIYRKADYLPLFYIFHIALSARKAIKVSSLSTALR